MPHCPSTGVNDVLHDGKCRHVRCCRVGEVWQAGSWHVGQQNTTNQRSWCTDAGTEWLVSICIGLGVLPLSLLTRFISRAVFGCNVPAADDDRVDMDLGYGAVVEAPLEARYSNSGEHAMAKSAALDGPLKDPGGKA